MRSLKKLIPLGVLVFLVFTMLGVALADAPATQADYQAVLDELNAEYGSNVHFPTQAEIDKYGLEVKPIDMTVDEYRDYMRRCILAEMEADFSSKEVVDYHTPAEVIEEIQATFPDGQGATPEE